MTSPAPIEAIERARGILETLAEAGPEGLPLVELATRAAVNKSTAYRALSTLRARGYVAQDPLTGHYGLGAAVAALSDRFLGADNMQLLIHPALAAISRETDELVHLGVLTGTEVVYVDKVEPQRSLRVWSRIGGAIPAATSAMGRALLAASPLTREQLAPFVGDLEPDHLWAQIEQARARGYARETEENEPGIACVGFALLRGNSPVAALSITAPAERMTDEHVDELVAAVRRVAPALLPAGIRLAD